MMPETERGSTETEEGKPSSPSRFARWHSRILGLCLVIFALEIGLFLLFFPWTRTWDLNWVPLQSQQWADIWMSPYFRGAISGLGLLNIYVSCAELMRQLKSLFSR